MDAIFNKNINMFSCPSCKGSFDIVSGRLKCKACKREYKFENGIPLLFQLEQGNTSQEGVTKIIKSFYEKNPFPNYDDLDSSESLREKSKEGVFANLLDEQIKHGSSILEVGCGTGQLSNFLGLSWDRKVFGVDMCMNSLKLGKAFRDKNKINNTAFIQMNLFKPVFKENSFDVVICNGVLHHTGNPFLGFESIGKLVKKNGYIIIGLYNSYGRITTDIRRLIFNATGNRLRFFDPRLRKNGLSDLRKNTWFMDQYKNPHESKHSMDEVLEWFSKTGFEFVNSFPKISSDNKNSEKDLLFTNHPRGTKLDRLFTQFNLLITGGKEGGFFIMIARKN